MNMQNHETQRIRKLIGIVDFKLKQSIDVAPPYHPIIELWALYKYEIVEFKGVGGGAISTPSSTFEEEWKLVTEDGCHGYKIT